MPKEKTLNDLLKAWRTIARDHFKRLEESLADWKKVERNEGWISTFAQYFRRQ